MTSSSQLQRPSAAPGEMDASLVDAFSRNLVLDHSTTSSDSDVSDSDTPDEASFQTTMLACPDLPTHIELLGLPFELMMLIVDVLPSGRYAT